MWWCRPVVTEMVLTTESLATHVTLIGSLVGVCPFMYQQIVGLGEVSTTETTDELTPRRACATHTHTHTHTHTVLLKILERFVTLPYHYISRESKTTRNVLRLRASVCLSVCLSAAACLHYCTDPDVT